MTEAVQHHVITITRYENNACTVYRYFGRGIWKIQTGSYDWREEHSRYVSAAVLPSVVLHAVIQALELEQP